MDCRDSPGPFRISSDVGVEVPIPWTASGRLLLAHMDDAAIRAFVPEEDWRLPDGRMIEIAGFLADVAAARAQGYAETTALADRFTWCMAAPIVDGRGAINRTLCLVLPVDTPADRGAELLALLRERARGLSLGDDGQVRGPPGHGCRLAIARASSNSFRIRSIHSTSSGGSLPSALGPSSNSRPFVRYSTVRSGSVLDAIFLKL